MQTSDFDEFETLLPGMTEDDVMDWFQKRLNRAPEALDVYKVAKDFYQLGAYPRALACLQLYCNMQGAQMAGRHLLAYCYLNMGDSERSLSEFKKCIKDGFHDDWQMVIELTLENENNVIAEPSED